MKKAEPGRPPQTFDGGVSTNPKMTYDKLTRCDFRGFLSFIGA
jgi:hypothetical protein